MSSRDPKEQENQKADERQGGNLETKGASHADQRQGGNLETKGASQVPPAGRAEKSDGAPRPSGEGRPSSGEVE